MSYMGRQMKESLDQMLDITGENFTIERSGATSHMERGSRSGKMRTIHFRSDATVQEGDVAISGTSGDRFYLVEIDRPVTDGVVTATTATYETETSRRRASAAAQPAITISGVHHAIITIQSQLVAVEQRIDSLPATVLAEQRDIMVDVADIQAALNRLTERLNALQSSETAE